jgi:uncharacterized membrane protein
MQRDIHTARPRFTAASDGVPGPVLHAPAAAAATSPASPSHGDAVTRTTCCRPGARGSSWRRATPMGARRATQARASMELFTTDGVQFLLRWVHFIAGVVWIGMLYYFNFAQVPYFAETKTTAGTGEFRKLVARVLWWFRWGAMFTFLSGLLIILLRIMQGGGALMAQSWGIAISIGALLGTIMFLNVWLVIWPKQQIVLASLEAVAGGGQADPNAAAAGARAFVASRTNALFSFPMLFFMGAASHLRLFDDDHGSLLVPVGLVCAIIAAIEANALFGAKGKGASQLLEKHVSVIHAGVALALVFYFLIAGLA